MPRYSKTSVLGFGLLWAAVCIVFVFWHERRAFLSANNKCTTRVVVDADDFFESAFPSSKRALPQTSLEELEESKPDQIGGRLLIHTYMNGTLWPAYESLLASFLLTQNLNKTLLVQWMAEDWHVSDDHEKRLLIQKYENISSIQFRLVDHFALARGSCFEDRPEFINMTSVHRYGPRDWANALRILLLWKYGGVWVDTDTIILLDFYGLHLPNKDAVVVGYVPDTANPSECTHPKEKGYFNNNFIHLTDPEMRRKYLELACQFRRKPLQVYDPSKPADSQFETLVPNITHEGKSHKIRVFNDWIFNDGLARMCWIRDDCRLNPIGLGETDPIWMRTNDMWYICERVTQSMKGYTADFSQLLRKKSALTSSAAYISSLPWDKHVWVLHHRSAHCRTSKTSPMGGLLWFHQLVMRRMGPDPSRVPSQPVDFLTYDPFDAPRPDSRVEFQTLIIFVRSEASEVQDRHAFRAMYQSRGIWFPNELQYMNFLYKLVFVVPYRLRGGEDLLLAELFQFDDLLLVDPVQPSTRGATDDTSAEYLTLDLRQGLLKCLNRYDAHFFVIAKNHKVFFNIRGIFSMLQRASNGRMFDKERRMESFVITHRSAEEPETIPEAQKGLSVSGDKFTTTTPFSHISHHEFVAFSRNVLPTLLGLNNTSLHPSWATETDLIYPLTTAISAAFRRHYGDMQYPTDVDLFSTRALKAKLPEAFNGTAMHWESQRLQAIRNTLQIDPRSLPNCSAMSSSSRQLQSVVNKLSRNSTVELVAGGSADLAEVGGNNADDMLESVYALTFVWDVPCASGKWRLVTEILKDNSRVAIDRILQPS